MPTSDLVPNTIQEYMAWLVIEMAEIFYFLGTSSVSLIGIRYTLMFHKIIT